MSPARRRLGKRLRLGETSRSLHNACDALCRKEPQRPIRVRQRCVKQLSRGERGIGDFEARMRNKITFAAEAVAIVQSGDTACTSGFVTMATDSGLSSRINLVILDGAYDFQSTFNTGPGRNWRRASPFGANKGSQYSIEPFKLLLSALEIGCTEPFREPFINWCEKIACFSLLTLIGPEPCETHGRA